MYFKKLFLTAKEDLFNFTRFQKILTFWKGSDLKLIFVRN